MRRERKRERKRERGCFGSGGGKREKGGVQKGIGSEIGFCICKTYIKSKVTVLLCIIKRIQKEKIQKLSFLKK